MKKLSLLLLGGILVTGAQAQQRHFQSIALNNNVEAARVKNTSDANSHTTAGNRKPSARGTAVPFVTEDFSSGTSTSLPTGWTRSGVAGGGWHWTKTAATSQFSGSLGTLSSTTASNGWMIFDSDSIGSIPGIPTVFEGSLVSPVYSTVGHSSVLIQFQSFYKKLQDSCFVDVSTNNFTSFTEFPVVENNDLGGNEFSDNPAMVRMNISSAAANNANVRIRFRYRNNYAGGTYAWMIDDIALSEIDPVEVNLQSGVVALESANLSFSPFTVFTSLPLQFAGPLTPLAALANMGLNAQSSIPLSVQIFRNGASVFNASTTYGNLPVNAKDSFVRFTGSAVTYTPTATGSYVAAFKSNQPSDGYTANDVDTFAFTISDSVYAAFGPTIKGSYFLHAPNTSTGGERSFFFGTRYDIPVGKSDTLTAVDASFANGTTAGATVTMDIYKLNLDATAWDLVGQCRQKALTTAEISTTTAIRFAAFTPLGTDINNALILTEGSYAVVAGTNGAAPGATVTINATDDIFNQTDAVYTTGQFDMSTNDGSATFGNADPATGIGGVIPAIRLRFGKRSTLGINNIAGVTIGKVYPNPAKNKVTLPVTAKEKANVAVTLSNTVGQVMATHDMGEMNTNQTANATFSTAGIANGVYFLTVEANGARTTSRFVVAH